MRVKKLLWLIPVPILYVIGYAALVTRMNHRLMRLVYLSTVLHSRRSADRGRASKV
jgi:hypothetical protein